MLEKKTDTYQNMILPLLSLVVALVSVFSNVFIQWWSIKNEASLKQYEVTFVEKQKNYSHFMQKLFDVYMDTSTRDGMALSKDESELEYSYFLLEPFLNDIDRNSLWNKIHQFSFFVNNVFDKKRKDRNTKVVTDQETGNFIQYRNEFHALLYKSLFENYKLH